MPKDYIFILKGQNEYELFQELKNEKEKKKFLKENVVYEYCGAEP